MSDKWHQIFLKSFSVMIEQNVTFIRRRPYELLGGTYKVIWRTPYDLCGDYHTQENVQHA